MEKRNNGSCRFVTVITGSFCFAGYTGCPASRPKNLRNCKNEEQESYYNYYYNAFTILNMLKSEYNIVIQ